MITKTILMGSGDALNAATLMGMTTSLTSEIGDILFLDGVFSVFSQCMAAPFQNGGR